MGIPNLARLCRLCHEPNDLAVCLSCRSTLAYQELVREIHDTKKRRLWIQQVDVKQLEKAPRRKNRAAVA